MNHYKWLKVLLPTVIFSLSVGFGASQLMKTSSSEAKEESWRLDNHQNRLDNIDTQNTNFNQEIKSINKILLDIKLQQRELIVTQEHILNKIKELRR